MNVPVLNYLIYHPDPVMRAAVRNVIERATGLPCSMQGSELPASPPASLAHGALLVVGRGDGWGRNAQRTLRRWREGREAPHVMVLLDPGETGAVRPLLDIGVGAFLGSAFGVEEFSAALQTLGAGGVFIAGTLARTAFSAARRPEGSESDSYGLTPREREILVMIALGLSNKDVARRLGLSVRTVETHRLNIRKKTRALSRRDLVEIADKLGLLVEYGAPRGVAERKPMPGFHED